jgi:hypothetical protein
MGLHSGRLEVESPMALRVPSTTNIRLGQNCLSHNWTFKVRSIRFSSRFAHVETIFTLV